MIRDGKKWRVRMRIVLAGAGKSAGAVMFREGRGRIVDRVGSASHCSVGA